MQAFKGKGIFLILMLMITIFISMLAGCATFEKNMTQILSITEASQDAGGNSVAALYRTGKISEGNWLDFKKYNDQFAAIHREAVDAMIKYRATKTIGDRNEVEKLIDKLTILAETVSKIVVTLTKKVEN